MTNEEFYHLWVPATVAVYGNATARYAETRINIGDYLKLEQELKTSEFSEWLDRIGSPDPELPDELKYLLKALVGPHAKTILRAYQIKHGVKTEEKVDG